VSRRAWVAAAVAAAGAAGAAAAVVGARRRLRAVAEAPDPYTDRDLGPLRGEQQHITTHDGGKLFVVDSGGDAPVVVLCHGYTATSQFWALTQPDLVARGLRVVAFDQRGHGHSESGSDGFGVAALGRDLATVLEALDLTDAVVVGHSMGGIGVQSLLVNHRDVAEARVRRAVICCSLSRSRKGARAMNRLMSSERVHAIRAPDALTDLLTLQIFGRVVPPASLVRFARNQARSQKPAHMAATAHALSDFDLRPGLHEVSSPVTVVAAGRDRVTPPVLSHEIVTALPACEEHWFPHAGHVVPWEHPGEFTDILVAASAATGATGRSG
jgi:non-heme chloroperoxidase